MIAKRWRKNVKSEKNKKKTKRKKQGKIICGGIDGKKKLKRLHQKSEGCNRLSKGVG
jgi:hypothetical protein